LRVPFFFVLAALGALGCSCPELGWCAAAAPISRAALPPRPLVGDVSCQPNDTDCNICTPDVEAQFASPWRGKLAWWTFRSRPGLEVPPLAAYAALKGGHVQGFVRLNGPTEAYAMVHSVGIGGIASLSIVAPDADGLGLVNLYRLPARKGHTSGAFSLGKYVGLIDAPRTIALLDPFAQGGGRLVHFVLSGDPKAGFMSSPRDHGLTDWSGGVAMTKLASGSYLLVGNEGGAGVSSGRSHLFEVDDFETATSRELAAREIGEASYPVAGLACEKHHHSENLSLITDCKTGHIYAVHVGSNDSFELARGPELGAYHTFWRVSRVVLERGRAALEPVGVYLRRANLDYCHGRSAGSAFVDPDTGQLELLCHERDQLVASTGVWRFWSQASTAAATSEAIRATFVPTPDEHQAPAFDDDFEYSHEP
jgi:hypothetical protein